MRHIFIVNPHSGPQDATGTIRSAVAGRTDCEVYVTKGPQDATRYIKSLCQTAREQLRFYACGGDGTLNEVVNGAVGFSHAAVGCYPSGSGNDFVKYFGGKRAFLDIDAQLLAPERSVDLIRVNDRYAINVVNIGFEATAAARMVNFRRFPLFQGPRSYYPAVVTTLIDSMKHPFRLTADGEKLCDGKILLCTFANGEYVGGSFRCAPRASVEDGLLEVCMVTPLSRLNFAGMIGMYQRGDHLDSPKMQKYITYRRAQRIEIESPRETLICLDGEITKGSRFTVEAMPGALRFILPESAFHSGKGVDMALEKAV
ncbi:MAG: YegS/Rv2252/BmrU family lipid kinase [Clostridia bacterium]|nr:YegS/Rv2252/BmrU family lipid kinase [Clostridia bacterium]